MNLSLDEFDRLFDSLDRVVIRFYHGSVQVTFHGRPRRLGGSYNVAIWKAGTYAALTFYYRDIAKLTVEPDCAFIDLKQCEHHPIAVHGSAA